MSEGEFNVVQFFDDGFHEYVRRGVDAKEAVEAAKFYTTNVVARLGLIVERVIITDGDDSCCFEWQRGEGVTFPSEVRRPWP